MSEEQLERVVATLMELEVHRSMTLKALNRLGNQARALTRRILGWNPSLSEKERNLINRLAKSIVEDAWKGKVASGEHEERILSAVPFLMAVKDARDPLLAYRKVTEKSMENLAETLPVWPWVEQIRGMGKLSLAIIVGEAGNLSKYDNPGKLWKRFGMAIVDGERQRRIAGSTEELKMKAILHGYNPQRHSRIWVVTDSLLKSNKDGYRTLYLDRKKYEVDRKPEMTKGHAHARASRYVGKRLLRDLWVEWRKNGQVLAGVRYEVLA